jgi:hypothetical protein
MGNLHDGSLVPVIFRRDGSRRSEHTMTKDPTENMASRLTFFCQESLRFQRIGIGRMRMLRSWKMDNPAATKIAEYESIHFTGGVLYIQFVQFP